MLKLPLTVFLGPKMGWTIAVNGLPELFFTNHHVIENLLKPALGKLAVVALD